ncbi:MAG: tetratricopeptide repeat protein [Anaerolineae bacterium]|nr:tetratricopeptide repeat protein [Anaerolineae bacterium]
MSSLSPVNPYVVGPALMEEYGFYGRQNLVTSLVNYLTQASHQNALVLHGQRRIGKTSLLYRLERDERLQQSHLPIIFDLQQRKGFPLARILTELTETISEKLNLDLQLLTEAALAADYNMFKREFLSKVYDHMGDKRLLILFDEFDVVVPADFADRFPADTFLGYLQSLLEEDRQRLAFIFVVHQRINLLAEGYRRLFRTARSEPVSRLGQVETYDLLSELGQKGLIHYTEGALETIWNLNNGHPYLTQLIGSEIFERLQGREPQEATSEDVEACLDKAMEHGALALDWFWTGFKREEQLILAAIAELTGRQPNINEIDIDKILREHQLFLSELDRRRACTQLIEGDFLTNTGGRHYKFAVEFIRRWIVKNHSLKEVKSEFDQASNPEALACYQAGLRHHEKGNREEAIRNFRQAVKLDPQFPDARRGLARAWRFQGDIESALNEYEEAYQLDPANTRDELIELRFDCIAKIEEGDNKEESGQDKAILDHARRILRIEPHRPKARQLLRDIYLRQANEHLDTFKPEEALASLQNLIEPPVPIIQDDDVGQKVRDLWLEYSQKLIQRKPPRWDEAQLALDKLDSLQLLDEVTREAYNKIVLEKARIALDKDLIEDAVTGLRTHLKPPPPIEGIKNIFYVYKDRQVEHQRLSHAAAALEGLWTLTNEAGDREVLLNLYHKWGDILLKEEKFDEAISVYQKGKSEEKTSEDFDSKISSVYLSKAAWHLDRHDLTAAETNYREIFAAFVNKGCRRAAKSKLGAYFQSRRQEQDWARSSNVLKLLKDLGLSGEDVQAWETELFLDQAKSELNQKQVDSAFEYLAKLKPGDHTKIKELIRDYLYQETQKGEWEVAADALKHLEKHLSNDPEVKVLRANWLFSWAKAIVGKERLDKNFIQVTALCQEALSLAEEEMPLIDLSVIPKDETVKVSKDLRNEICNLLANLFLEQAQTYLDHTNLTEALKLFNEALHSLPFPPENLASAIRKKLEIFSQNQIRKENYEKARQALEAILNLEVGGREVNQMLTTLAIRQAELLFKSDEPRFAFSILNNLKTEIKDIKPEKVTRMAYKFSRLYAGRTCWKEAMQTLKGLGEWLAPLDEQVLAQACDILNRERLDFVVGKRLVMQTYTIMPETIEYLNKEIGIIEDSYEDAKTLSKWDAEATHRWIKQFIEKGVELGQTYLFNHDPSSAIQVYQKLLNRESQLLQNLQLDNDIWIRYFIDISIALGEAHLFTHDLTSAIKCYKDIHDRTKSIIELQPQVGYQISQSLYNYSENLLAQENAPKKWDLAELALQELSHLKMPTPYGLTEQPDPRVDGAIQRAVLQKAQAQLQEDNMKEAFSHLKKLPSDWPEGEIKKFVWKYSEQQQGQRNWENSIVALKYLDRLLVDDRQARDQDTLGRLVKSLLQWGQHLEYKERNLAKAAGVYYDALQHAQDMARARSLEPSSHFIDVTLKLIRQFLGRDNTQQSQNNSAISEAIQYCEKIVYLPEHEPKHEDQVNALLYSHAQKLAEDEQWERAYLLLDALHNLYANNYNDNRNTRFAIWRWKLVLDETKNLIETQQLDTAFSRLVWFKEWLEEQEAPATIWTDSIKDLKKSINYFTAQRWYPEENYELAIQTLNFLLDLLPDDPEVIGWHVETRCLWGQSLHNRNQLVEALKQYQQALNRASNQEIVPISEIDSLIVETLLDQAEQYLDLKQPNLQTAIGIYQQALQKRNNDLDPSERIYDALKKYSEAWAQQKPPNWDAAHQALNQLVGLELYNNQVLMWQQELTLREIDARLKSHNLKETFARLEELERPWPVVDIQKIVQRNVQTKFEKNNGSSAIEILQNLAVVLAEDSSVRQWIINELMNLGEQLSQQGKADDAGKAFKAAVALD